METMAPLNSRAHVSWPSAAFRGFLLLAVAALYLISARDHIFGSAFDEPLYVLLSKSLLHGSFATPDGRAVTDPWLGYPLLIAPFTRLLEPCWALFWIPSLSAAAAALVALWRLCHKLLPGPEALAAWLLAALNPIALALSGILIPDMAFLAVSLFLLDMLAQVDDGLSSRPGLFAGMTALAALAALIRPQGVCLDAAILAAVAWRQGFRKAGVFAAGAFLPLGLWLLRNAAAGGTATAYWGHWASQLTDAASGHPFYKVLRMLQSFVGLGILGIDESWTSQTAVAAACVILAGYGLLRLYPRRPAVVLASAIYTALLAGLHFTWKAVVARYAFPFMPLFWIAFWGASSGGSSRKRLALAGGSAALLFVLLRQDIALAKRPAPKETVAEETTMAWIRANIPSAAAVATNDRPAVWLFAGRRALSFAATADRDAWIKHLVAQGAGYVHVVRSETGGYMPDFLPWARSRWIAWMDSSPYFHPAYTDAAEHTAVYRLTVPDPGRYLRGWKLYEDALKTSPDIPKLMMRNPAALRWDAKRRRAREMLLESTRLAPSLAWSWASLAALSETPGRRLFYLRRAAAANPSSDSIAALLKSAGKAAPR